MSNWIYCNKGKTLKGNICKMAKILNTTPPRFSHSSLCVRWSTLATFQGCIRNSRLWASFQGQWDMQRECANSTSVLPGDTNINTSCIMPRSASVIPAILSGILCGRRDIICEEKSDLMSVVQGRNAIRDFYMNCQVVPQAFCLVIVNRPILTQTVFERIQA